MPTTPQKARMLLKQKKAQVVSRKPLVIQLRVATGETKQEVKLGVDSGYQYIGFSAITEKQELISGEFNLLKGMSERLKERSMYRTQRRNRLRYRKPRWNNRKRNDSWLAPSIQHKLDTHIRFIKYLNSILPISNITIEVGNFDIQKIKNPNISGKEYQEGEQKDFWNLREYILRGDNHKCQNPECANKSKNKILQVHHLGYWKKDRTDRPSNLITLCTKCHTPKNHKEGGFLYGWEPNLKSFKEATFMSMVRWRLVNELGCEHTYGAYTKQNRIKLNLEKTHFNDAFVIAGGTIQKRIKPLFINQIRRHNRSLEKFYDAKYIDSRTGKKVSGTELFCGRRTRNKNLNTENLRKYRKEKISKGRRQIRREKYNCQPGDLVRYNENIHTVKGVFNKGSWIRLVDNSNDILNTAISKVELLKYNKGISFGI
jgi:hypothetical protein